MGMAIFFGGIPTSYSCHGSLHTQFPLFDLVISIFLEARYVPS